MPILSILPLKKNLLVQLPSVYKRFLIFFLPKMPVISEVLTVLYTQDDVSEVQPRLLLQQRTVCRHFHHRTVNQAGSRQSKQKHRVRHSDPQISCFIISAGHWFTQCEQTEKSWSNTTQSQRLWWTPPLSFAWTNRAKQHHPYKHGYYLLAWAHSMNKQDHFLTKMLQ